MALRLEILALAPNPCACRAGLRKGILVHQQGRLLKTRQAFAAAISRPLATDQGRPVRVRATWYYSPDEHAFCPRDLPDPILPPLQYPQVFIPAADLININPSIWKMYLKNLLPAFVSEGDDANYGSTAVCDVLCLQALSKRIHYGKFVAEAKFRDSPDLFEPIIRGQDRETLMRLVTFESVEASVQRRVEMKAKMYGQEIDPDGRRRNLQYKINPQLVAHLYGEWVMPLTKRVQVEYLLRRLD